MIQYVKERIVFNWKQRDGMTDCQFFTIVLTILFLIEKLRYDTISWLMVVIPMLTYLGLLTIGFVLYLFLEWYESLDADDYCYPDDWDD